MRTLCCVLLSLLCTSLAAQKKYTWDDFVQYYYLEQYASEETVDEENMESLQEELHELFLLHENPININTASISDLQRLPFLHDDQIEQIHAYIYLHGEMHDLSELRLVPGIDAHTRRMAQLFLTAVPSARKPDTLGVHLRQKFASRMDIPLYYRKGYQVQENGYVGNPLYHKIQYAVTDRSGRLQAGLRMEKDPGERFYDSYGAWAMVQKVKHIEKLVIGDYRAGFAEGLVMGGGLWHSRSTPSLRAENGIRPMRGMDEYRFLRGFAGELAYSYQSTGIAFSQRLHYKPSSDYTFSLFYRYFSKEYYSFQASTLAQNSRVQNENGVLLHMMMSPWGGWNLTAYLDLFYHPWPRYGMTHSSYGQELMIEPSYAVSDKLLLDLRYRMKRTERYDQLEPHHLWRLRCQYDPCAGVHLQTTSLIHHVNHSNGWGVQQSIKMEIPGLHALIGSAFTYFDTDDYLSRISFYEQTLMNTFYSYPYYGQGCRFMFLGRYSSPGRRWVIEAKYGVLKMLDRSQISSGLQTIFSSWKNDISVQLTVKI